MFTVKFLSSYPDSKVVETIIKHILEDYIDLPNETEGRLFAAHFEELGKISMILIIEAN